MRVETKTALEANVTYLTGRIEEIGAHIDEGERTLMSLRQQRALDEHKREEILKDLAEEPLDGGS